MEGPYKVAAETAHRSYSLLDATGDLLLRIVPPGQMRPIGADIPWGDNLVVQAVISQPPQNYVRTRVPGTLKRAEE
jgi:hypothetical protein